MKTRQRDITAGGRQWTSSALCDSDLQDDDPSQRRRQGVPGARRRSCIGRGQCSEATLDGQEGWRDVQIQQQGAGEIERRSPCFNTWSHFDAAQAALLAVILVRGWRVSRCTGTGHGAGLRAARGRRRVVADGHHRLHGAAAQRHRCCKQQQNAPGGQTLLDGTHDP